MKTLPMDHFKTINGQTYELLRMGSDFIIKRGKLIFHTCETIEMATNKFYRIKEMFRLEQELAI